MGYIPVAHPAGLRAVRLSSFDQDSPEKQARARQLLEDEVENIVLRRLAHRSR